MHSALPAITPTSAPRYPTPLADAARERTRRLMATHMRSAHIELAVLSAIAFAITFAAAYQL